MQIWHHKEYTHEFVPLLLGSFAFTLYAGNVYEREAPYCADEQADCWSVISLSIITKLYAPQILLVPLLQFRLPASLPAHSMLMIERCGVTPKAVIWWGGPRRYLKIRPGVVSLDLFAPAAGFICVTPACTGYVDDRVVASHRDSVVDCWSANGLQQHLASNQRCRVGTPAAGSFAWRILGYGW
jgi:hypothetical protein